jgi:ABC-type lipoprotein release transport system permease subunit
VEELVDNAVKQKKQLIIKTVTITIASVLLISVVLYVAYFYGIVRPKILADNNVNTEGPIIMTVSGGNSEDIKLNAIAVKKFESLPGVTAVSPIITYPAQIVSETEKAEAIVYGVNPEHFGLEEISVDYGKSKLSDAAINEAIVSAGSLKPYLKEGPQGILGKEYEFKLVKFGSEGILIEKTVKLKVVGITKDEDIKYAYTGIDAVNVFDSDAYTSVKIQTTDLKALRKIRKEIENMGYPTTSTADYYEMVLEGSRFPWTYYSNKYFFEKSN